MTHLCLLLLPVGALLLVLRGAAWLGRRRLIRPIVGRKLVHLAMGLLCLALPSFVATELDVALLTGTFLTVLCCIRAFPNAAGGLGEVLTKSIPDSYGEFFFTVGVGSALWLSRGDQAAYSLAISLLAVADVAAWGAPGVGRRHPWTATGKTVEGSLAFMVTGWICGGTLLVLLGQTVEPAALALLCLVITLVEGVSPRGSDNLTVPLGCCLALKFPDLAPAAAALFLLSLLIVGYAGRLPRRGKETAPTLTPVAAETLTLPVRSRAEAAR